MNNKLASAIYLVRRNLPRGVTTFGPCVNECGRSTIGGRGGGPCLECARDQLSACVGPHYANLFINKVAEMRDLEDQLENISK